MPFPLSPTSCPEEKCCDTPPPGDACIRIRIFSFDCCDIATYVYVSTTCPLGIDWVEVNGQRLPVQQGDMAWGGIPNSIPARVINGRTRFPRINADKSCGVCVNAPTTGGLLTGITLTECRYEVVIRDMCGGETTCDLSYCLGSVLSLTGLSFGGYTNTSECRLENDPFTPDRTYTETVTLGGLSLPDMSFQLCQDNMPVTGGTIGSWSGSTVGVMRMDSGEAIHTFQIWNGIIWWGATSSGFGGSCSVPYIGIGFSGSLRTGFSYEPPGFFNGFDQTQSFQITLAFVSVGRCGDHNQPAIWFVSPAVNGSHPGFSRMVVPSRRTNGQPVCVGIPFSEWFGSSEYRC